MKICFLLQRNFAYIGHFLAMTLKEKYSFNEFCAYVVNRKSYEFLAGQNDIPYTQLLLDEDLHDGFKDEELDWNFLNGLEKEYGLPNLWPYLASDRIFMHNQLVREYPYNTPPYTYEKMLKILQLKAKAIIKFLDEEKPDVLICSVVGSLGSILLYQIAKKKGIKTYVVFSCLMKERYTLSENYIYQDIENDLALSSNAPLYIQAKEFLNGYRTKPHPHQYIMTPKEQSVDLQRQFQFLKPANAYKFLKNFYSQSLYYLTHKNDYSDITPINYLIDRIKRKLRNLKGVLDLYSPLDPKENFAFYPLQYEPEFSLMVQAPFFSDQTYVIKQTARSLPVGFKLYVKEHPQMVEFRPRSFYKELLKIPNVKLINPAITSFQIYQHAKLITTITGTAGWEGSMLKIPVITFGDNFYNQLSFVKNCRAISELPNLVKEQLENFNYNEEEITKLIASIFKNSTKVNLHYLWTREPDLVKKKAGLEPFADFINDKLKNLNS